MCGKILRHLVNHFIQFDRLKYSHSRVNGRYIALNDIRPSPNSNSFLPTRSNSLSALVQLIFLRIVVDETC